MQFTDLQAVPGQLEGTMEDVRILKVAGIKLPSKLRYTWRRAYAIAFF
jgi:hypothetical protein